VDVQAALGGGGPARGRRPDDGMARHRQGRDILGEGAAEPLPGRGGRAPVGKAEEHRLRRGRFLPALGGGGGPPVHGWGRDAFSTPRLAGREASIWWPRGLEGVIAKFTGPEGGLAGGSLQNYTTSLNSHQIWIRWFRAKFS
jgi:hypothetical protein